MTTQPVAIAKPASSLVATMAAQQGIEPGKFIEALKATVVPAGISDAQLAAFLMVANSYELNPLLKEIYAFPAKGGGIVPIVSIDGWCNIINKHPQFNGMEFEFDRDDNGKLLAITCIMYRKDRDHPVKVVEFMAECVRTTDPWRQCPNRMLRHKAMIQAGRYCFGFGGIYDSDEGEDVASGMMDVTPSAAAEPAKKRTARNKLDEFAASPKVTDVVEENVTAAASVVRDDEPPFDAVSDDELFGE